MQNIQLDTTINRLYKDSKNDYFKIIKGAAKSIFRPIKPIDFKDVYLAISEEQGKGLVDLIKKNNIKKVVEFGTSFGISTLFLAKGVLETEGNIVTTELIESKALKALDNFKKAGVDNLIDLRIGNAMDTLLNYDESVDLLLLDGWKDLYLPLFRMLEKNFHSKTIVYVDNADMDDSRLFLETISKDSKYQFQYKHRGKVALISVNSLMNR